MTLIENWREAWKFNSVQSALILAVANALFALMPSLSSVVPFWVYALIMTFGNLAIVALRLVAQDDLEV